MKIRLMGTPAEVEAAVTAVMRVLDVVEVSSAYPSRRYGGHVRVYITAEPRTEAGR